MSVIAKVRAQIGALVVATSFAGAAIVAQPGTIASAATVAVGNAANAPTIVVVRKADVSNIDGVIGRLQNQGFKVVNAPDVLSGEAGETAQVESFLGTIPGSIVLVAVTAPDAAVDKVASDDAQVKALVYVSAFEAGNEWRTGALSCTAGSGAGFSSTPFLSSVGFSSPVCTTSRDAFETNTAAGIAKTAKTIARAALAPATPMR